MNCRRTNSLLSAFLDGELTGAEMLAVRKHLDECGVCFHEHQSLLETKRLVSSLMYKAPRADLEALLLTDQRHMQRGPFGGILDGFVDWSNSEIPTGSLLRPRPLAVTILFSVAGLYLASTALNPPGDRFVEADRMDASYPAFVAAGRSYMVPVALAAAIPEPPVLAEPSRWVEIGPTHTSFVTITPPGSRMPMSGTVVIMSNSPGPYVSAPMTVSPPQLEAPSWGNPSGLVMYGSNVQVANGSLVSVHP